MKNKFEQLNDLQMKLYKSVTLYRMQRDLFHIEEGLKANEINEDEPNNIIVKTKNVIKKQNTENLNVKRKDALKKLNSFQSNNLDLFEENELKTKIEELLKADNSSTLLDLFSITFVNDKTHSYIDPAKTLEDVSILLFDEKNELKRLQNEFKKIYKEITGAGLTVAQKGGLIGTAVLSFMGMSSSGLLSFVKVGALVGGVYAGMKFYNIEQVKEDLKKLDYEQIAYLLTLKYILFDHAKDNLNDEQLKEHLNDLLTLTSDLKADSLYLLLVEKEETQRNKLLTDAYYRFDKKLIKCILPELNDSIL